MKKSMHEHSALIQNGHFRARIARKECGHSNEVGKNSIFWYERPKQAFHMSSERIARVASCIELYFSLQMHAKLELAHRLQTSKMRRNSTSLNTFRVKKRVSKRVSPEVIYIIRSESLGSDFMHDSQRDSLQDSFLYVSCQHDVNIVTICVARRWFTPSLKPRRLWAKYFTL